MHPAPPQLTRDLLLIGGGHAHALVLRNWGMNPQTGTRLTVINPGPTAPYTGMLPGHVAGHYTREDLDIDLVRLCRFAGARLIDGAVDALEEGRAHVAGQGWVPFDVGSIDIGIHSEMTEIPGFAEHAVGAKPLGAFASAWREHRDAALAGEVGDAAIIGGGVAGAELAMAMAHALRETGAKISLIETTGALTGVSPPVRRRLMAALDRLGVALHLNARVTRIDASKVVLEDQVIAARFITGAAGARPHAWVAGTDLPLEQGFIRVTARLQVEGRSDLFGAGDCVHMNHAPRPKAGVFAVRQAPVLHDNLRAALSGGDFRRFEPQRTYLKLISLGDKEAIAEKGKVSVAGRWLWRLKDKIDRDFMTRLTDLPAMEVAPVVGAALSDDAQDLPLCGGCGAKVGAGALGAALASLPKTHRPDVLAGPGDDAAVLVHGSGRQVMTTDHLRAFTADPALMARITAVHALGDIWAMGATPQAALAHIVLPRMSERLQERTLAEILPAMETVVRAAGGDLVGGHTTMGAEMTLGLSITGLAEQVIGLDGARPGDVLILTRPVGTGVILAAEMRGDAPGQAVLDTLRAMAIPQGDAAQILAGAHAMTDVTGFGLAGHLANICAESGVGARLTLQDVPFLDPALTLAAAGYRSSLWQANRAAHPGLRGEGAQFELLFDPQTAGGLLAAVDARKADTLVAALVSAGHKAARIASITEQPGLHLA